MILFDVEGRITWCSEYRCTPENDTLGRYAWELHAEDARELVRQKFEECQRTRETQTYRAATEFAGQRREFEARIYWVGVDGVGFCGLLTELAHELTLLSQQEQEVMRLLARGLEVKTIADEMNVTVSTAHTYLRRIRSKLNIEGHAGLIALAIRSNTLG